MLFILSSRSYITPQFRPPSNTALQGCPKERKRPVPMEIVDARTGTRDMLGGVLSLLPLLDEQTLHEPIVILHPCSKTMLAHLNRIGQLFG
jgi:hypothetical protein